MRDLRGQGEAPTDIAVGAALSLCHLLPAIWAYASSGLLFAALIESCALLHPTIDANSIDLLMSKSL
jgi:hypothetical protein